jgi:hypothetical protein
MWNTSDVAECDISHGFDFEALRANYTKMINPNKTDNTLLILFQLLQITIRSTPFLSAHYLAVVLQHPAAPGSPHPSLLPTRALVTPGGSDSISNLMNL